MFRRKFVPYRRDGRRWRERRGRECSLLLQKLFAVMRPVARQILAVTLQKRLTRERALHGALILILPKHSSFATCHLLLLPLHQKCRYLVQIGGFVAEAVERVGRLLDQLVGLLDRRVDSEQRRISGFLSRSVFARGLAKLFGGLGHVEHVIDNLESEPDVHDVLDVTQTSEQ